MQLQAHNSNTETQRNNMTVVSKVPYCKTLNVSVPFISRARQNRKIKGREYQL